jgi:hypothetical protein
MVELHRAPVAAWATGAKRALLSSDPNRSAASARILGVTCAQSSSVVWTLSCPWRSVGLGVYQDSFSARLTGLNNSVPIAAGPIAIGPTLGIVLVRIAWLKCSWRQWLAAVSVDLGRGLGRYE